MSGPAASTADVPARFQSFLAFDFGTRRVGTATGNRLLRSATPQPTIAAQGDARFAQIDLDSAAPLTDFAGRRTTHGAFARDEGIRFTPMLVIYGPSGERLAEPVVGMGAVDFYGDRVMKAIDQARQRLEARHMHSAARSAGRAPRS